MIAPLASPPGMIWTLPGGGWIEPVGPDCGETILEVYRSCEDFLALGPAAQASAAMVREDLELAAAEGGKYCGIFLPDGRMVGVFEFVPAGRGGSPREALLALLMIARPWRRTGLGRAVVSKAEQELFGSGAVDSIRAPVQVNNLLGLRFWEACGYGFQAGPFENPDHTTVVHLKKDRPDETGQSS